MKDAKNIDMISDLVYTTIKIIPDTDEDGVTSWELDSNSVTELAKKLLDGGIL